MNKKEILLSEKEYKICNYMLKNGVFNSGDLAKVFGVTYSQANNAVYRVVRKYKQEHLVDFVYKYLTNQIPPFEQRYKKITKRIQALSKKPKRKPKEEPKAYDYTPEELRRMKMMRKLGFSEAEIVKELR